RWALSCNKTRTCHSVSLPAHRAARVRVSTVANTTDSALRARAISGETCNAEPVSTPTNVAARHAREDTCPGRAGRDWIWVSPANASAWATAHIAATLRA